MQKEDAKKLLGVLIQITSLDYSVIERVLSEIPESYNPLDVALVGTEGVGKSSLFNLLFGETIPRGEDLCHGSVREKLWIRTLRLIDVPSYDPSNLLMIEQMTASLIQSDAVIQVCDMDAMIRRADRRLSIFVSKFEKPYVVALNKADIYGDFKRERLIARAEKNLGCEVICTSAISGEGVPELLFATVKALETMTKSRAIASLSRIEKLVANYEKSELSRIVRYNRCERIISEVALEAAKIGASSEPSQAELLALHRVMIHRIAEVFSEIYSKERIVAINLLSSKAAFFLRVLFQEIKRLPAKTGNLLASTHAFQWTNHIGELAVKHFEQQLMEEEVSSEIDDLVRNLLS